MAAVVADLGVVEARTRKLVATLTLLLCIAMGVFTNIALSQVLRKLVKGVRYIWPDDADYETATKSAISQARYRLGARPVATVFHRVCTPIATEQTPGASLCGLRLMAINGTTEDGPDTPANVAFFGRLPSAITATALSRGDIAGGLPLRSWDACDLRCGFLVVSYRWTDRGGLRLLRSVRIRHVVNVGSPGFHSFEMAVKTRRRKNDLLGAVYPPM